MNGKVAKTLRKHAYPQGYDRQAYYAEDEAGTIKCTNEREKYKALKYLYKKLKNLGK